jgi:GAF domain-containing protein
MPSPRGPARRTLRGSCAPGEGKQRAEPAALTPEHLARLLDLSRALAGACEHAHVATVAAERARALTGASAAQVAVVDDDGRLAVLAEATGAAGAFQHGTPGAIRPDAPEHDVVRRGGPIWIGTRRDAAERWPGVPLEALTGGPDGASWAFLPLVSDGETSGVLTLVFDEVQALDDAARAFLGEVAAACGEALARGSLFTRECSRADASEEARAACEARQRRSDGRFADRTHLYERERFARARAEAELVVAVHAADDLERAQPLTAALLAADTAEEVMAALGKHGASGFGAVGVELTRGDEGGPARGSLEPGTPEEEVLRSGVPRWLDAAELARRFPDSQQTLLARGAGAWLGVPVPGGDGLGGVLTVAFPRGRAFTPGDRARLTLLATGCAALLSRRTARDAGAAAQAREERPAEAPPAAFVVQYDEVGRDGPMARVLGVFSSETSARQALRALDRTRALVVRASITSWTLDVAVPRASVEVDLGG